MATPPFSTKHSWGELQNKYKVQQEDEAEMDGSLNTLVSQYLEKFDALSKQRTSINKKVKCLPKWLLSLSASNELDDEEEYFLFTALHVIKIHQKMSHFLNPATDTSEWDYAVYFWGPLLAEVFFANTNIRTKWGDTVFAQANGDEQSNLKIDLWVIFDRITQRYNMEHDVSACEFAKYDPG
jgi:hypothetical protein